MKKKGGCNLESRENCDWRGGRCPKCNISQEYPNGTDTASCCNPGSTFAQGCDFDDRLLTTLKASVANDPAVDSTAYYCFELYPGDELYFNDLINSIF